MNNVKEFMLNEGITFLLRRISPEDAIPLVEAAYEGGARVFEITFNPSDPDTVKNTASVIRAIKEKFKDKVSVGSGTVIYPEYVVATKEAGGDFMFSPNVDPEIIALSKKLGLVTIPGAFTPTECMQAMRSGADLVKLFPITVNDIPYLKNITGPLSHMKFLCTGGINPDTIEAFFDAGCAAVGTGASVFKRELVENKDYEAIKKLTAIHVAKVKECLKRREK